MSLLNKLKLNVEERPGDLENNADVCEDDTIKSKYFNATPKCSIAESLLDIELTLVNNLKTIVFKAPVASVYSPLDYAQLTHSMFVRKYCKSQKKILFLGLNPGPWGMAQTGVPFGEVQITRDWLGVCGPVGKPDKEISSRLVCGFECHRSEISGKKFWSLFRDICHTPDNFFRECYMHNYCPLLLMKNTGANITPADLKTTESVELLNKCDESLAQIIRLLNVETVVGVGRFAEKRALLTVDKFRLNAKVVFLIHPSPRIPRNENWCEKAKQFLEDLELLKYLQPNGTF